MKTEIEKAKEVLRDAGYFVQNLWSDEDVNQVLRDSDRKEFTKDEAIAFFDYVGDNHDATVGMSWETIDYMLDNYLSE